MPLDTEGAGAVRPRPPRGCGLLYLLTTLLGLLRQADVHPGLRTVREVRVDPVLAGLSDALRAPVVVVLATREVVRAVGIRRNRHQRSAVVVGSHAPRRLDLVNVGFGVCCTAVPAALEMMNFTGIVCPSLNLLSVTPVWWAVSLIGCRKPL